jgi:4-hydroxybenzoate polyprenyltransferase
VLATLAPLLTFASIARLHIVAIGALGTLTFGLALCGERPWALAGLVAVDWFVVNLLNRVVDLREDAVNQIRGTDVVARHRRLFLALGVATLAASLAVTWVWFPDVLGFRVAFHVLGFLYNWPLIPAPSSPNGRVRIKQLYFWKNTASAMGFVLTCLGSPLASFWPLRDVTWVGLAATALFFVLFELSYEVLYDLRDVDGDRAAHVRTYPVVHGASVGWNVARGLMIASFVVVVGAYLAGVMPWRVAIMGAAPLLQLVVATRMVQRGITSRDCVAITWLGCALLAGYHVWVALGLPGAGA